jgi:hypothetical protein
MSADYYLYGGYSTQKIAKIKGGAPDCPTAVPGSILPSSQAGCDQGTVCILQVTSGLASAWPPVEEYPGKKLVRTTSRKRKFAHKVYILKKYWTKFDRLSGNVYRICSSQLTCFQNIEPGGGVAAAGSV